GDAVAVAEDVPIASRKSSAFRLRTAASDSASCFRPPRHICRKSTEAGARDQPGVISSATMAYPWRRRSRCEIQATLRAGLAEIAGLGLLIALSAVAAPARAVENGALLVRRLRSGEDFRVRTQAALALGASKDKSAIKPLCAALADDSRAVRAAAAAAL